ncbi:MAG TPA: M24 family metallopeptidase [Gaiellaceae bacterium]|nr:M24 family metallopeptidase [Gaiellaceae bacterium]
MGHGVRPRAGGQVGGRARLRPRERRDQRRRLPCLPRGLGSGPERRRGARAGGAAVRRARLRAPDDEHGARRRRVRDRARRHGLRRVHDPVARDRRPRRPLGRGLARARHAERRGEDDARSLREYYEVAQTALRAGVTAHDVHRAVSAGFTQRGYHLGHVTGHSIGMTMIEHPRIGEGVETELAANMVFSMHPHAIAADGRECLYMQDTWLVTEDGGVPLAGLEMRIW